MIGIDIYVYHYLDCHNVRKINVATGDYISSSQEKTLPNHILVVMWDLYNLLHPERAVEYVNGLRDNEEKSNEVPDDGANEEMGIWRLQCRKL